MSDAEDCLDLDLCGPGGPESLVLKELVVRAVGAAGDVVVPEVVDE